MDAGVLSITFSYIASQSCQVLLARRLATILPDLTLTEAIETARVHRVAGLTDGRSALITTRPFQAPHHTISHAGLIGGGHIPQPRKVSLAHHGILFLDELPECKRHVLEVLRLSLSQVAALTQRHQDAMPRA